eukprot:XP_019926096.1 PREDICTED: U6 snRNA phosphodiesterase isoform X2 [Crassostrea gigas]
MNCLVQYSDSEDELSDKEDPDYIGMKRKNPTNFQVCTENNKKLRSGEFLPLPDSIKTLFSSGKKPEDNPEVHEGIIRSFEHLEGNWATHIGVSYDPDERMIELIDELLKCLRPLEFKPMKDLHLSLSRTVAIRHHWIQPLTDRLRRRFKLLPKTFLSLTVSAPGDILQQYTKAVDECFEEYKLPKYYENPSFHISIGWCLKDVIPQISEETLNKLQDLVDNAMEEYPELRLFPVEEAICKSGNKQFPLPLSDFTGDG